MAAELGLTRATAVVALVVAASAAIAPANATVITDPVGDFNTPFYVGRQRADLDVVSVSATFDGAVFHIGATMAAPIDTSPTAGLRYVFGVNKGGATSPGPFADVGNPNVIFNAVFTLTGTGVLGGAASAGSGSSFTISGSSLAIDIPLSALPSTGFTPLQYGFNLWPRDALAPAGNGQIADFAPDNATFTASSVPEPFSLGLFASGVVGLGLVRRFRRG
jgi:hypothetical protein